VNHSEIAAKFLDGRSWAAHPALSPDGERVAFVVSTIDLHENRTVRRIWLEDVPLTAGPDDVAPEWSPDGSRLAFVSKRSEKKGEATVHVLPVDGPGEVRTVCTMPDGAGDLRWSPDGRWLAFISRTRHERYEAKDVRMAGAAEDRAVLLEAER
jgi:dipeptidyl aminopeptidase/acylaminoacyl peptidase